MFFVELGEWLIDDESVVETKTDNFWVPTPLVCIAELLLVISLKLSKDKLLNIYIQEFVYHVHQDYSVSFKSI